MANENINKTREDRNKEKLRALVNNRMGLVPESATFNVSSRDIEDAIAGYLVEAGIQVVDNDEIIIKAIWNNRYDSVIKGNRNDRNEVPFNVVIGVRNRNNKKKDFGNAILNKLNRLASEHEGIQLKVLGWEDLNKAVKTFAKLDKDGDPRWYIDKRDSRWAFCKLRIDAVLQFVFADEGNKKPIYDFVRRNHDNKNNNFSCKIIKSFERDNFKNRNRDNLAFLNSLK